MEGTKLTLQERESKLYDDFKRFTSEKGESIRSYYWRYAKLINDMNNIGMTMKKIQVNTKFVNHLRPAWSSYEPPVVPQQSPVPSTQLDSGFFVPSFLPTDDPIASLNKAMLFLINTGKSQAKGTRAINIVGDANANQPWAIRCYNFKGEGHIAKQCTARKKVKDSEWFKDKMLFAQAQKVGVVLCGKLEGGLNSFTN
ncbi:hypothetical protein Tco_0401222 [Tanacetum coccineum]